MAKHNILGQKGEEIAERFLLQKGYTILAKNWRYKKLEVDIIALKDNLLVSVEVKTRTTDFVENLGEIVTRKKQRFVIEATNAYMEENNIEKEARFDIIFIVMNNGKFSLEHVEEAYSAIG